MHVVKIMAFVHVLEREREITVSTLTGFVSSTRISVIVPDWSACAMLDISNHKCQALSHFGPQGEMQHGLESQLG